MKARKTLVRFGLLVVLGVLAISASLVHVAQAGGGTDFIVAIDEYSRIYYAQSNGDGTFGTLTYVDYLGGTSTRGIAIDDFDNDGDMDFIAGRGISNTGYYYLFLNDGGDNFAKASMVGTLSNASSWAMDMASGDFNNDGIMDFVANTNTSTTGIFLGLGDGSFTKTEVSLDSAGRGMDVGDFDNDGNADIVRAAYSSGYVKVYWGDGTGAFPTNTQIGDTGNDPYGVVAGDFDNDGFLDVITNYGSNGDTYVWAGNGDRTFDAGVYEASLDLGRHGGFDAFDFNGDGNLDVVIANHDGRTVYYYPGNGDGTFGAAVTVGTTSSNSMGISAPPIPTPAGVPTASIAPAIQTLAAGVAATFDGSGSTDDMAITSWSFDPGDGGPVQTGAGTPPINIAHTYPTEGTFYARLKVTDGDGKSDYASSTVIVQGAIPVVDTTPVTFGETFATDGLWPLTLDGPDYASDAEGIVSYEWDFGDGYADDFEDGNDNGWTPFAGTWAVDASSPIGGSYSYRQTNTTADRTWNLYDKVFGAGVTIEADIELVSGGGEEAHILFGAQNELNNYEYILRGRGNNDVLLYRRVNGSTTNVFEYDLDSTFPSYPIDAGNTYHVKIVRMGSLIEFHLDGYLLFSFYDGTFGPGKVGLSTYDTQAQFDNLTVTTTASGQTAQNTFGAGTYNVQLTVTDAAGQTATGTIPMTMQPGAAPVSDANGPYAVDEFTGNAFEGGWTVALDGSGSSDDAGIARYVWDLGTDTFDGTALNAGKWVYDGNTTQNDEIAVVGSSAWGVHYFFSEDTYSRAGGMTFEAKVKHSGGNAMVGFKNTNTTYQYNQMPYAIYFNGGNLRIYENGADRGDTGRDYSYNTWYDVRIELKPTAGARYYYRASGSPTWILLYDSDYGSDTSFKRGMDVYSGTFTMDDMKEIAAGVSPSYRFYGAGSYPVSLTVYDAAGQSHTASTAVITGVNSAPVADAGSDQTRVEADAVDGVWAVDFDASGSTDDHGIYTYEWDWAYDGSFDPSGDTGVTTSHSWTTPGTYTIALRVTDHALQTDVDTATVTITAGAPPVADANGPYNADEFSGNAVEGGWTATLDGTGSTDDVAIARYVWDMGTDTFDGTVLNTAKWVHNGVIHQNNEMTILGNGSWGQQYVFSKDTYTRVKGAAFETSVNTTGGNTMVGFKNTSTTYQYGQMPYAIYFNSGNLLIYENGTSRGDTGVDYSYNTWYDVRIELKPTSGARYYYRATGSPAWILLYDSDYGSDMSFKRGMDVNSGTFTMDNLKEIAAGATPSYRFYGLGSHTVSLTTWDHAGQSDTDFTSVTTSANNPPVSNAGLDLFRNESDAFENTWAVAFDGSASSDDHGIYKYEWDFGDGYADDFEDGNDSGWTPYAGTWAVDGATPLSGAFSYRQSNASLDRTWNVYDKEFIHGDGLIVEADVKIVSGSGQEAMLVFGAQDQYNGYEFILRGRSGTDDVLFYKKVNNSDTNLHEFNLPFDVTMGTVYHMKVVITGSLMEFYLDDNYLFAHTDTAYNSGMVGLSTYRTEALFDNLVVTATGSGPTAQHTFTSPGAYMVGLRVTDHALQSMLDTATVTIAVGAAPVAEAGPDLTTEGHWPVVFNGGSSIDDFGIYKYVWDFGDGNTGVGRTPSHIYWAPGDYTVTLTVYDNLLQSDTDTLVVHVITDAPPVADAGGPYTAGAGGPPAYFNGNGSTDDHGIVKFLWDVDDAVDSDGDGDFTNDQDVVGRKPFHTYSAPGVYTVTLTVVDGADQTSTDSAIVSVATNLAPDVIVVPWVAANPLVPHETYNGFNVKLKAIVRDAGTLTYQWDFGDGSAPTAWATVSNKYAIETDHVYPGSPDGTPFTATLSVKDSAGLVGSDEYYIVVRPNNADTRTNIAIDDGLWYMHKAQDKTTGRWSSYGSYYTSSTGSALQAFEINGHLEDGDNQEDPYVETVRHGFQYLFTRLRIQTLTVEPAGNPDTNGNGIGISAAEQEDGYQLGMVMDAIASSSTPLALATTGPDNVKGRFYFDILTDMVDLYAWSQADAGSSYRGGWRYDLYDYQDADNSAAQWGAIGMQAAEDSFGINIPQWVKDENADYWLWHSYNSSTGLFGYTSATYVTNAAPASALVQLAFDEKTTDESRWRSVEDYYANNWNSVISGGTYYLWDRGGYPVYAFTKAMRLAQPDSVVTLQATGLDWYNDAGVGVRKLILDKQTGSGSSRGAWALGGVGTGLSTAWHIIMLTPTLFVQPPVADAGDDIIWAYDLPLSFDASGSFHMDPARQIVLYEWDFDGNGTWDFTTTDPSDPAATYAYPDPHPGVAGDPPQTFTVRLRVTDDGTPAQTDIDTREVTVAEPPHAPYADADGPYTATVDIPFTLNGSSSHDIDPGDSITLYEWDMDGAPWFDDVDLSTTSPTADWTFGTSGVKNIALRVTDNGAFNPPGCTPGADCTPMVSEPDYSTVTVQVNLPPVADANGPYTVPEGETLILDGSGSSDPNGDKLTYAWDLDNDGEYDDSTAEKPTFSWADDGTYTMGLKVSDSLLEGMTTATVTVTNVIPRVDAGYDLILDEGAAWTRPGSFTDPGADTWVATVDYGDGSGPQPLPFNLDKTFTMGHTYADNGIYTMTVTVTDDDGGTKSDSAIMTVNNVPPSVDTGPAGAINEGDTFSSTGLFTDPGADTWTATADYGDGSGVQPLSLNADKTFALDHTYSDDGTYVVTVTVADDDGGVGADTAIVVVENVAPTVDAGPDATINEGETFSSSGYFTDPGDDTWTATVDYGDGSGVQPLALNPDKSLDLSHTYAENGLYSVIVTVTDDDGGVGSDSATVIVADLGLTAAFDWTPEPQNEGAPVQFTDQSTSFPDTIVSWFWDFGGLGSSSDQSPSFTFADNGAYSACLTVTDEDGSTDTVCHTVTILDLAPTAAFDWAPEPQDEGSPVQFTDQSTSLSDTMVAWYWDFGGLGSSSDQSPSITFEDNGAYSVCLTVTDEDGSTDTICHDASIDNAAPTVDAGPDGTIDEGDTFSGTGSFTDPGDDTWTATVDYGDGSGVQPLALNPDKTFDLSHIYADDGTYTVTVTVTDDDGGATADTVQVTVNQVGTLLVDAGPDATVDEGDAFVSSGFFQDDAGASWTATVDYGDGSGAQPLALNADKTFSLDHTYASAGTYTVAVTASNDLGTSGTDTANVMVRHGTVSIGIPAWYQLLLAALALGSAAAVFIRLVRRPREA